MAQTRDQRKASDAVGAWLAHNERNHSWLKEKASIDLGTVGTFLAGQTWPKTSVQGKIEKALGWPPGTIRQIAMDGVVPDGLVTAAADVGGPTEDPLEENDLLYRRPDGLSDSEWEQVKAESREFIEWQIEKASRER